MTDQPVLYTPRLVLRPVEPTDQQKVFEGFSHPDVIAHFEITYKSFEATAEQMEWYANNRATGSGYAWVVTERDKNNFMGVFSLYYIHPKHKRCETGYWLFPEFWGKGYAKEALGAILEHADTQLNMHRIAAEVEPDNTASKQLLSGLGFNREGVLKDFEIKNEAYIDLELWARIHKG